MRIHVYYVGRARSAAANSLAQDYVQRVGHYVRCEMREIKPDRTDLWTKHPSAAKVLLDPAGKPMDSARFTGFISKAEQQARDLIFVIGGADGLPQAWREHADLLLALSPMTLPHELARVLLVEQLYRAYTTLRGHPYPR